MGLDTPNWEEDAKNYGPERWAEALKGPKPRTFDQADPDRGAEAPPPSVGGGAKVKAAEDKPSNVLSEAEALVYGDRAAAYGPADENHTAIVRMFETWMDMRYESGVYHDLDAYDSCVFNLCQKFSRLAHSLRVDPSRPHHDSIVDGAGYFGVIGKIAEERRAKAKAPEPVAKDFRDVYAYNVAHAKWKAAQ